jgi:hypothetical protein
VTSTSWLARLSGTWVLCVVFVVTLPLITAKIRASDEIEYVAYLHSLVFDHDLEFGNEYEYFYRQDPQGLAGFKATFLDRREPRTDRHINYGPIGSALFWAPAYLAAHAVMLAARSLGFGVIADGLSRPYSAAVYLASALYAFIGLVLIHRALRRFAAVPEPVATWTVIALWLATPVIYYMTLAAAFAHACSLFAVALLLSLWLHWREDLTPGRAALLGAAGGLAGLVREQDLFFLLLPAADLALRALARRRLWQELLRLSLMTAAAVAAFTPQLLVYKTLNGVFGPSSVVERKMHRWASPHFFEVLFNPGHGLFVWSPIVLVAVLGLVVLCLRRRQTVPALLLFGFLVQVWINGAIESWHMAGAFGARRFVSSTFVFGWGLAFVLTPLATGARRWIAALLVAAFVWWNVSLMTQFALRLINHEGNRQYLEWPRVAVNQFSAVPARATRAAYLFFADRSRLERELREAK